MAQFANEEKRQQRRELSEIRNGRHLDQLTNTTSCSDNAGTADWAHKYTLRQMSLGPSVLRS